RTEWIGEGPAPNWMLWSGRACDRRTSPMGDLRGRSPWAISVDSGGGGRVVREGRDSVALSISMRDAEDAIFPSPFGCWSNDTRLSSIRQQDTRIDAPDRHPVASHKQSARWTSDPQAANAAQRTERAHGVRARADQPIVGQRASFGLVRIPYREARYRQEDRKGRSWEPVSMWRRGQPGSFAPRCLRGLAVGSAWPSTSWRPCGQAAAQKPRGGGAMASVVDALPTREPYGALRRNTDEHGSHKHTPAQSPQSPRPP
ncbi:uncharacterized protein BJ171DRAFT_640880, partial [Polychytrium aggregatum]|uniref:uncharacterized protein n=1 Tax=Polychytrium aggregatum TaxID=110093 RepID=UPI0022FEBF50